MKRWLTTSELGVALAKRNPRVAKLNGRRRAEYARRLVARAEKIEDVQWVKRVGKRVLISVRALSALLPADVATVDRLDVEFSNLAQNHRALKGQVNGHGTKLREHAKRIEIVEKTAEATVRFQAEIARIQAGG